jgi:hypothetical protein
LAQKQPNLVWLSFDKRAISKISIHALLLRGMTDDQFKALTEEVFDQLLVTLTSFDIVDSIHKGSTAYRKP